MRKEDLMKYYEPLMRGYSALDVETERPYTLPHGKASYGRLEKEAYDIKKDKHIAPAFKPAFSETEKQQKSLRMVPYYHLNYASPKRCAEEIVQRIWEMDGDGPV